MQPGRGLIMAMPHLGGWEWGGMWLTLQGYPMTVVVEALEPPELFEWFAGFRRSLGMNVVPVGPSAGTAVLRALADGHIVCLLSDRSVGDTAGVQVTFFDEVTTLPAGAATVALRTGAPLMPAAVYFCGPQDGHFGMVRPPIDSAGPAPGSATTCSRSPSGWPASWRSSSGGPRPNGTSCSPTGRATPDTGNKPRSGGPLVLARTPPALTEPWDAAWTTDRSRSWSTVTRWASVWSRRGGMAEVVGRGRHRHPAGQQDGGVAVPAVGEPGGREIGSNPQG